MKRKVGFFLKKFQREFYLLLLLERRRHCSNTTSTNQIQIAIVSSFVGRSLVGVKLEVLPGPLVAVPPQEHLARGR
jgi:hypothetical protein